jgi:hypothetical protein
MASVGAGSFIPSGHSGGSTLQSPHYVAGALCTSCEYKKPPALGASFLIEIQDHQARTLAPRYVDTLVAPRHHTCRCVFWRGRARAGVDWAHYDRRAHNARDHSMCSVGGARASERDPGGVPVSVGVVRVPSRQRRSAVGMRSAGANGSGGRRCAATRGRRPHAATCCGEPVTVPQQCTCGRVRIRFLRLRCSCAMGTRDAVAGLCVAQYTVQRAPHGRAAVPACVLGLDLPECMRFFPMSARACLLDLICRFSHRACTRI